MSANLSKEIDRSIICRITIYGTDKDRFVEFYTKLNNLRDKKHFVESLYRSKNIKIECENIITVIKMKNVFRIVIIELPSNASVDKYSAVTLYS